MNYITNNYVQSIFKFNIYYLHHSPPSWQKLVIESYNDEESTLGVGENVALFSWTQLQK